MTVNKPLDLDTSFIQSGLQVKNYKQLCQLLHQPEYGGTQKKHQLKEFERYFSYERSGHKFLIKDVYTTPLPSITIRGGNNNKYIKNIESILLSYLLQQEGNKTYLTKYSLYKILGMINKDYILYRRNYTPLLELSSDMTQFEIEHFFERCDIKLNSIMKSAINSLEKRHVIKTTYIYQIGYYEDKQDFSSWIIRDATEYEVQAILQTEQKVLNSFGLRSKQDIFRQKKVDVRTFFTTLYETYRERYGWGYVKECYCFSLYDQQQLHQQLDINDNVQQLNTTIHEVLNTQAKTKYEKYGIGTDIKTFCYPATYVPMQLMLSDKLIKLPVTKQNYRNEVNT